MESNIPHYAVEDGIPHFPMEDPITYIAGPMTSVGPPTWNYPLFHETARKLREAGHKVINPAELHEAHSGVPWDWYMRRDLRELMKCGRIVILRDWHLSKGAQLERKVARELGMETIYWHNLEDFLA